MANVQLVKNMWAIMKELAMFFNMSPKRQQALDDHAKDDETRVSKLVDLSTTRWMARHDALSVLLEVFSTGVSMLKSMSDDQEEWRDSTTKATGLLASIKRFDFLITLIVTSRIMEYTKVR